MLKAVHKEIMSKEGDGKVAWVNDNIESALIFEGFDDAIIGFSERYGRSPVVAYDRDKCIDIFVERDGMTYEEAEEYLDVNYLGAWEGEKTPEFITLIVNHTEMA
jgi:hypothetical protein